MKRSSNQVIYWNDRNSYQRRQTGAALIMMMIMLLIGSTNYIASQGRETILSRSSHYLDAFRILDILQESRTALLAYSVSYADNYAPTGAGPGHFPCPDSDPPDDGNSRNDGPNPPCSKVPDSLGRLPRVTHGRQLLNSGLKMFEFYSLQSLLDRQPWYVVSSGVVNNPLNRIVNTGTLKQAESGGRSVPIARIVEPGPENQAWGQQRPGVVASDYLELHGSDSLLRNSRDFYSGSNDIMLDIQTADLLPALHRRVAGFSIELLRDYRRDHCIDEISGGCYLPAADVGTIECNASLEQGALPIGLGNCESSLSESGLLEGVPVSRHWFVRNQWYRYVRYVVDPVCRTKESPDCDFEYQILSPDSNPAEWPRSRDEIEILVGVVPVEFRQLGKPRSVSQLNPLGKYRRSDR